MACCRSAAAMRRKEAGAVRTKVIGQSRGGTVAAGAELAPGCDGVRGWGEGSVRAENAAPSPVTPGRHWSDRLPRSKARPRAALLFPLLLSPSGSARPRDAVTRGTMLPGDRHLRGVLPMRRTTGCRSRSQAPSAARRRPSAAPPSQVRERGECGAGAHSGVAVRSGVATDRHEEPNRYA